MINKFLAASSSIPVVAITLTNDLITGLAAAVLVAFVNFYVARTARLLAMAEIAKAIKPVESKIDAIIPTVESKIDAIIPTVASINAHVNSEKTQDQGVIAAHKLENALQREMIEEMRKAAALLAQAKASADLSASVAQAAMAGTSVPKSTPDTALLEQIETNTDATAKNTAKTDATVTALKKKKSGR